MEMLLFAAAIGLIMTKSTTAISVVLPAYNQMTLVETALDRLSRHLSNIAYSFEILVVDDGSSDATEYLPWEEYQTRFRAVYLRSPKNEGKGGAVRRGLNAAAHPIISFTDIDLPIELDAISVSVSCLSSGAADFIIGNRFMNGSLKIGRSFWCRIIGSKVFNLGVRLLAVRGCSDTQCCLKGFTSDALARILPRTRLTSFAFDVELIFTACQMGMTGAEYPVTWTDRRGHRSHIRLLWALVTCLRDTVTIRRGSPDRRRQDMRAAMRVNKL
jgi:dolichyl-phosphate beta-glucosyltransferase